MRPLFLFAAILFNAGCGGGGGSDDSPGICVPIGGQATQTCTGCTVENPERVVDSNLGSAASVVLSSSAQATIRGTSAQEFGNASKPTVLFSAPDLSNAATIQITLRTYRNGTLRDSGVAYTSAGASNTCTQCGTDGQGRSFAGIDATQPFDAIEVDISLTGGTLDPAMPVYELCRR